MELVKGLNESAKKIYENNKAKGFWDKERNIGESLMLVVTELSEAMNAHQKGFFATPEVFKDTFEDELADTVIRVLDLCGGLDIDIEKHINLKVEYNKTRARLHGKLY
jgi:NTP pyrophosphatase (non-canonical NTP hydrolase)